MRLCNFFCKCEDLAANDPEASEVLGNPLRKRRDLPQQQPEGPYARLTLLNTPWASRDSKRRIPQTRRSKCLQRPKSPSPTQPNLSPSSTEPRAVHRIEECHKWSAAEPDALQLYKLRTKKSKICKIQKESRRD